MRARVGLGFGLERLGLIALSRPKLASLLILAASLVLVLALPTLKFEADIVGQTDRDSAIWQEYEALRTEFTFAAPQIYILVDGSTAASIPDWLGAQNRLVLNLRLIGGVADVQSVFSLRSVGSGGTVPLLNPSGYPGEPGALRALAEARPDLAAFLNPDGPLSRISIVLDPDRMGQDGFADDMIRQVRDLADASGLVTSLAGPVVVQGEIAKTLLRDMVRMVLLSIVVGWSFGLLIFSDVRTVMVVNIVSPVAMLWTAGFAALTGETLNSITIVFPLLASIIAFADAVHLVVPMSRRLEAGDTIPDAVRTIVADIGPATALTSMTTALAFGSLAVAGGGMIAVAWLGVASVVLAWLAVITLGPLLCLTLARPGFGATRFPAARFEQAFRWLAVRTIGLGPIILAASAIGCVALLLSARHLPSDHVPTDYLPAASDVRLAEAEMERHFSGGLSMLVAMPLPRPDAPSHPENILRLQAWHEALSDGLGDSAIWSRVRLPEMVQAQLPQDMPDLARDGEAMLLVVNHSWEDSGAQTIALFNRVQEILEGLPDGEAAQVASLATLVAQSAVEDIDRLRAGVLLSVVLASGLIALSSGSLAAGLAVGLSVGLSVLVVLVGSGALAGAISYSLIVALVISVGIAIDDGIHLVNKASADDAAHRSGAERWTDGLAQTGGAILLTSLILVVTLVVTQTASMPALRVIGREIALALTAAFFFTTFIVAPTAVRIDRTLHNLFSRKATRHG